MQQRTDPRRLQALDDWPATREEALARLAAFAPRAGRDYAETRNYDLGAEDRANVSVLSPYIRHRLITEDEIVSEVLAHHGLGEAEKFIQEVCWRTYWKGWLEMRPAVWQRYCADVEALERALLTDAGLAARLEAAVSGKTGIACFDAWALELQSTGYLHNHARMWFASIWIFTLKLPWQLGADFFLRHLLDGDPASNTLSWRWICGLHTPGKTYPARATNIAEFSGGRFALPGGLAGEAVAVSEATPVPKPQPLKPAGAPPAGPVVLLLTEDDLLPETWPLDRAIVRSVVLLDASSANLRLSPRVRRFKSAALADARMRAARQFRCPATVIDALSADAAGAVIAACGDVSATVTVEVPVGPVRTAVVPLIKEVARRGVSSQTIRRSWDDAFWPHATAGYFRFKDAIPTEFNRLGIL